MDMTRRNFMNAVAVAAVLPVVDGSPVTSRAVTRATMWSPDRTSDETLIRCNRLLTANPDDVLALVHRGQIPCIYFDQTQAWADLTRAIALEATNPCCWYIRGTCFDRVEDLRRAISMLEPCNATGQAICSSAPDYYRFDGTEEGELFYLVQRELGYTLESDHRFHESIAAYKKAGSFEMISQENLQAWAESSFLVKTYCRSFVEYDRLVAIEPKREYIRRREECARRMRP